MAARALPSAGEPSSASQDVQELLPDLPGPAIACILQHVPLRQRLNCCALVCRSWAAAAAAAPADVYITLGSPERCEQLQDWLDKHGGVVVGLSAGGVRAGPMRQQLQLPVSKFTQLHRLNLNRLKVSSSSSSITSSSSSSTSSSSAAVTLPRLQELTLLECNMTVQLLSQLLSATTLSRLRWQYEVLEEPMLYSSYNWTKQLTQKQAYSALWQRLQLLPKLADLMLNVRNMTAADIAPLSNLQHLQCLELRLNSSWSAENNDGNFDAGGPRQLLAALQHLTQLQHLQLEDCELIWAGSEPEQEQDISDASYQCFSALTASTQLTALHLDELDMLPVPQAAFQHMFPPGRVLPVLKVLHLVGKPQFPARCVEAAQATMMAASCPALQQLELAGVTPWRFDDSCLAQLSPAVTCVEGLCWTRPVP